MRTFKVCYIDGNEKLYDAESFVDLLLFLAEQDDAESMISVEEIY